MTTPSDDWGDILTADGFDAAFMGLLSRFGQEPIACYDYHKVIAQLCEDMSLEDAEEYFEFNVIGAWVGDRTPCFLDTSVSLEQLRRIANPPKKRKRATAAKALEQPRRARPGRSR